MVVTAPAPGGVAVLGAGSIGVAFAVQFARSGCPVRVFDVDAAALERGRAETADRFGMLHDAGLLEDRGSAQARVSFGTDLRAVVADADLVQECAPERLEVKQDLFARTAALTGPRTVLASSSSAITASRIAAPLEEADAGRVLVGHPGNPPYLLPVVEVVPSPRTRPDVVTGARALYRAAGLRPVLVRHEPEGFVFNRLQGAVLREAYALVRDGVVDVDDLDEIVRSGLGRRWSVTGPFETSDLNVRGGITAHAERMGQAYARMGAERGQDDPWTPELVARVAAERRRLLPLEQWAERVRWRDARLLEHSRLWDEAPGTAPQPQAR